MTRIFDPVRRSPREEPPQLALDLRDRALEQVDEHADEAWKAEAVATVEFLIASGKPWTTDDVWAVVGECREPRALGAIIREARRAGRIVSIGYQQSTRAANHARPVAVWRAV